MPKLTLANNKPKPAYRITNWSDYNQGLKQRGSLTLWIEEGTAQRWYYQGKRAPGGKCCYDDACIELLLTLKVCFKLPLRQLQGFATSLLKALKLDLKVPDYSQICRRQKGLYVGLKANLPAGPCHLVLDSSGLKVYGEGEWKVRKHGYGKRRTWRKIHLATDETTGQITAQTLTEATIDDASQVEPLLTESQKAGAQIDKVGADGAYDTQGCYDCIIDKGARPIVPPRRNAAYWVDEQDQLLDHPRNEVLAHIDQGGEEAGRAQWKKESGYHRRSKAETSFSRWKTIHGPCLQARKIENQRTEAALKAMVLNRYLQVAAPISMPRG